MKLIVAASLNNVIGKNNQLPWKCPEDLKHFKKLTVNNTVIMGFNTYKSIGGQLPNRINVVIDKNVDGCNLDTEYLAIVESLDYYLAAVGNRQDTFVIGGEKTYQDALATGLVTEIILTRINMVVEGGDRFFEVPEGWTCLAYQKLSDMATVEYYKRGN